MKMSKANHWGLITKYLSGESSPEEDRELERWRKDNSQNEHLFLEAQQIWKTTINFKDEINPAVDGAWLRLKQQIEKTKPDKQKDKLLPQWLKIAATVLLIVSISYLLKIIFTDNYTGPYKIITENTRQTEIESKDSVLNFSLPDNSKVWLNTHSQLAYSENFTDTARIVYLDGEGYFEIERSEKPFIVIVDGCLIRVVGTSFNVRAVDENIEVNVYSGEVEFSQQDTPGETISVKKDETITCNKVSGSVRKQKNKSNGKWWGTTSGKLKNLIDQAGKDFRQTIKKSL